MRKHILALAAAIAITGVTALSMFVIGVNALVNPSGTSVSNSPAAAISQNAGSAAAPSQSQIAQLQNLIGQYQNREQQYQQIINQDQQKLDQAANEMQMVQQLLTYLQSRGLIRIDNSGRITVTGGSDH